MTMTNPESPWIARVMRTISCLALLEPSNTMAGAIQEGAGEDVLSFTKSCNRGMVSRIARSLPDSGEVARAFRDERPVFRQDVARGSVLQLLDFSLNPGPARASASLRAIEFAGDELAVPGQDGPRRGPAI
jgi:hypothetical protein